jgi:cell division septation protein DedD
VTVGEGQRNGEYVVQVERWYLVKEPVQTPPAPTALEREPQPSPEPRPKKKPKAASKAQ